MQSIRRRIFRRCFVLRCYGSAFRLPCGHAIRPGRNRGGASIRQIVEKLAYEYKHVKVYQKVPTTEKRISLIFEGAADEATMMALADLVKARRVKTVFFLPGSVASDNPELAKYIADAGVTLGSYG